MNAIRLLRLAADGNLPVVITGSDPLVPTCLELLASGDLQAEVVGDPKSPRAILHPRITAKGRARLEADAGS